jgi:hypothetical protein
MSENINIKSITNSYYQIISSRTREELKLHENLTDGMALGGICPQAEEHCAIVQYYTLTNA